VINFTKQLPLFSKAGARGLLIEMANASVSALQRIFMAETLKNGDCLTI